MRLLILSSLVLCAIFNSEPLPLSPSTVLVAGGALGIGGPPGIVAGKALVAFGFLKNVLIDFFLLEVRSSSLLWVSILQRGKK